MSDVSKVRELLQRHYTAWSTGDIEGVVACFNEGCVFEDLALEAKIEGRTGVRKFVQMSFNAIPDFKWNPKTILVDGDRCSVEWQMDGTLVGDLPGIPGTSQRFDVRGLSTLVVRGGLIQENRDYWCLNTLVRQVGYKGVGAEK